ncbi:hypothetical protein F5877DRAFT_64707 [Lentinula edodes]|nr:hypothetical protein F5877DRAFT_64707 [Lentinula edodes]
MTGSNIEVNPSAGNPTQISRLCRRLTAKDRIITLSTTARCHVVPRSEIVIAFGALELRIWPTKEFGELSGHSLRDTRCSAPEAAPSLLRLSLAIDMESRRHSLMLLYIGTILEFAYRLGGYSSFEWMIRFVYKYEAESSSSGSLSHTKCVMLLNVPSNVQYYVPDKSRTMIGVSDIYKDLVVGQISTNSQNSNSLGLSLFEQERFDSGCQKTEYESVAPRGKFSHKLGKAGYFSDWYDDEVEVNRGIPGGLR